MNESDDELPPYDPERLPLKLELTLAYIREDDGWIVNCLELPGVVTQGRSKEEARGMAFDAARLMLEVARDKGRAENARDDDWKDAEEETLTLAPTDVEKSH